MAADAPTGPWALERWALSCAIDNELSATAAHVLLVLAIHANDAGECWPGLATLAAAVRRRRRETSRALTELRELGLIERRGRGPGQTRLTRLTRLVADSRPTASQGPASDSRPTASQEDSRHTATQPDSRPAAPKTRGQPHPRLAASRTQNPPVEPPEELEPFPSSYLAGRVGARNGASEGEEGSELDHLVEKVWSILHDALDWLGPNDHGRPWPQPNRQTIRQALIDHPQALPMAANVAMETKATVQDQDRAPNIAGLYVRKLADYAVSRSQRRS